MPWVPERSTINQTLQFGLEATPGTNVPANKLIQCFQIVLGMMADVAPFEGTGRKYPTIVIENSEWVEGTLAGEFDYNGIVYALSGVCGAATSIVAHGASATAKDWTFVPPLTGSVQPQTYTIEQGENNAFGNAIYNHKVNYGLISEFGYKGDRRTGFNVSGKVLAQALQRAITMTATPTTVALQPTAGKHFNFYLDPTSAALGTTQLLKVLNVDYLFSGLYGMFFPLNRANLGWSAHVDLNPGCIIKLILEADATGMTPLTYLQAGTTQFLRVQAQGPIIDNLQVVTIAGGATGGTFTLSYKGQTTALITYSAALTSATVNTAFQLLSTVSTNCTVTGGAGGPYTFTFSGPLVGDMSPVGITNVALTGGTPTVASVATAYATFQHDMAVKVSKPNPFSDNQGVFAEEWEFTIVEDATWAAAQKFLITTLLTAL
jgi:hypothetical protein